MFTVLNFLIHLQVKLSSNGSFNKISSMEKKWNFFQGSIISLYLFHKQRSLVHAGHSSPDTFFWLNSLFLNSTDATTISQKFLHLQQYCKCKHHVSRAFETSCKHTVSFSFDSSSLMCSKHNNGHASSFHQFSPPSLFLKKELISCCFILL